MTCVMASSHVTTVERPLCSSPSKLAIVNKSVANINGKSILLISAAYTYLPSEALCFDRLTATINIA